jgi:hypothetical protein
LEGATVVAEAKTIGPVAKSTQSLAVKRQHAPQRLLYAGTAILILLLLLTDVAVITHLRQQELRNGEDQLKSLSLILAEQAERSFESVDLVLSSVAAMLAAEGVIDDASLAQKMTGHDVHLLLREKIGGLPQLAAVILFDADGKTINSSRTWPTPAIDISDRGYFQILKGDPGLKDYVTEPLQNRDTGTWTIYLVHQVRGANGEFLGLILGAMEMRYFEDFYRAISLGKGASVQLQRLDGVMLARFPQSGVIGKVFATSQHLLGDGISGTVNEYSPIDGLLRIKAARRVTGYPVLALATETQDAVLANWRAIAWLLFLGSFGCAMAIAIAAFAFGRQWKQLALLAEAQACVRMTLPPPLPR